MSWFDRPPYGMRLRKTRYFRKAESIYEHMQESLPELPKGVRAAELSVIFDADPIEFVLIGLCSLMKFKNKFEFYTRVLLRKAFQIYYCPPDKNVYFKGKPYLMKSSRHGRTYDLRAMAQDRYGDSMNEELYRVKKEVSRVLKRNTYRRAR